MNKELFKSLTGWEKFFYITHCVFSYFGSAFVTLWAFLIEKITRDDISIVTKMGLTGILCLVILIILTIVLVNRHINKKLETNNEQQQDIMKQMLIETDTDKKEKMRLKLVELENYRVKVKAHRTIFKDAVLCGVFVFLTLLFFLAEKKVVELRGTFMGISSCLLLGCGFNTAYELLHKKLNTKK